MDPIPYQPIGGLARARGGFVSQDVPAPLGSVTTVRTDYEAHFLFQNLMLTGEALRLAGWVHGAPMIPHVWQRDPASGVLGLGFREYSGKDFTKSRFKRWPPVPASQPAYEQVEVAPFELATFVPVSVQLLEDNAYDLESELASDLAESFGVAEGVAFVNGTGSGQPKGLMAATGIAEVKTGNASAFPATNPADVTRSHSARLLPTSPRSAYGSTASKEPGR